MDAVLFRSRLRRNIFDEDVRIEAFTVQRGSGTFQVLEDSVVGKTGVTEEFNLDFSTHTIYNDLIYAMQLISNWTVAKASECVGSKQIMLVKTPEFDVTSRKTVYSQHFFHDDELDDLRDQGIAIWNDTLNTEYSDYASFPEAKSTALLWLVTSLAFMVRASSDAVSFYEYERAGQISSISLGGELSISKENVKSGGEDSSVLSWAGLANMYDKKWQNYVETSADSGAFPEITEIEKKRVVRETGTLPYKLDKGFPALLNLSATIEGSTVTLNWSPVYSEQFYCYRVKKDGEWLGRIIDNHDAFYVDDDVASGDHSYVVVVLNKNEIASPEVAVSVTV